MKKFKNVFLAFFVTALTSLNLVLPAYAEETTTQTVDSAGFSVNVVGDGTVTLSSGDFTKSLSNGDIYNADYEEGTEIKIVSKSNENAVIDDVTLNSSTISGFTTGKKSFSFVYTTKTADANFSVTFKTKETQKTESSTSDKTTSEQSSVQNEDSNTSEDASSNDENEDSSSEDGDKVRLVYQGKKKNLDSDLISAKYSNMYVLEYDSQDEADKAKSELKDKGKVDTEQVLSMDENTQSSTDVVSTKDIDTAINQADQKNVRDYSGKNVIALIDTGSDGSTVDAVSFVDGDTTDHQGHASKMIKAIRKQDSNAKILALKALDDNGNGTTASIVSAIQYAIDSHVSIINMSFSGKANDDTSLIEAKVKEAVKAGITVVASAGNNALDASNFVPANVSGVITVGACSDEGIILSYSNYGDDVDWYVNTDATSSASATVSGMISKNGKVKEDKKTVFSSKNAVENTTKWANSTGDNISVADAGGAGGGSGGGGGNMPSTVSWRIRDNNDNGFGLALVNGQPNTDAVLNVIMNNMNLYCLPDYAINGVTTRTQVKNALQNAINQCRANYQKIYGTTDGFKPRIVAVGVCHYAHAYQGKSGEYNASWYANDEWYWNPAWKNASNNNTLTLYHGGKAYTTASAFHNGGNSLTNMATNDLAGNSNIRIIVLDDTQPEPPIKKGKLAIKKVSANTAITDNNSCYSLKGAEYGVYKSESDAKANKNKVKTLKTEENGWSNTVELDEGTYYLKETKNPKGYALNSSVVKVTIKANETTQYGTNNELKDYPQSDPVVILLEKVDKETNKNKPQGSASLAGAEFTVKYYKGLYDSDPAKSGQIPARSWVLKTDKDGFAYLHSNYKVSGDDFYMFGNIAAIPVGTITVQETKAPTGYFINNEVFVRKIEATGTDQYVSTYNQPKILEKVIKFDIKKVQEGTSTPVSGAVFRHTLPNGSTEDLETNGSGEITITGLASGTHKIKEIKSPDGYQLNPNEVVFNVASGTGKITFTSGTNSLVTYGTKDSGDGYATFSDKVNPFNLKITKTNEHGKVLKGAEFRLYSDADCKNVVDTQTSDDKGLLTFKNLDVEKTYYFKETKAPQGYRIPVDENGKAYVHSVYVKATPQNNAFDFKIDNVQYNTSKTSGNIRLEGTKKDRVVAVDITNKTTQLLPETGSSGTILLIGLGIVVIAFALYMSKKEKLNSK
ncbi:SpaA isopeptide-forming pilin-related protein [Holdemanella porci]|uniref:SpaA isopeptide-forming pilin-related protein n=1 Tax=Holdemanella porci TaxID=2652276 RepID=UPI002FD8E8B2